MTNSQQTSGFSTIIQFFSNLPLLRVIPGGKRPAEKRGVYDARLGVEASELEGLVGDSAHFNAGVRLGNGLVVLDIDPRNGGSENLDWLLQAFGGLPFTWKVETAGGGWHYYFKTPQGLRKRLIAPGVELLAEGCYALIPGSRVNGNDYKFAEGFSPNEVEIAEIPSWLIEDFLSDERLDCEGTERAEGTSEWMGDKGLFKELSVRTFPLGDSLSPGEKSTCEVTSSQLAEELFKIHPDCPREMWIRVGMVLAGLHDDLWSDEQFDCEKLWHAWSKGSMHVEPSEKYSWKEADKQWTSFRRRPSHIKSFVSFGTLVYLATECLLESDYDWTQSQTEDTSKNNTVQRGEAPCPITPQLHEIGDTMRIISDTADGQDLIDTQISQLPTFPLPTLNKTFMTIYDEAERLYGFRAHENQAAFAFQALGTCMGRRLQMGSGAKFMCHTMLVGDSNEGKSVFLEKLQELLDTAVPGYAVDWALDSPLGFQKILAEQPNRLTIGDEKGSFLMAGNTRRSSNYEVKAYSTFRGMLDGRQTLKAQISKKDSVVTAHDIYVTCAMTTTEDEVLKSLNILSGSRFDGITRRFFVFRAEPRDQKVKLSFSGPFKEKQRPSDEAVRLLRTLSCQEDTLLVTEASAPPNDDWIPTFTAEVEAYGSLLLNRWNDHGLPHQDKESLPLFNRALTDVRRFAIFLAAIDGRRELTRYDVDMGYQWAQFFYTRTLVLLKKAEKRAVDIAVEIAEEAIKAGVVVNRTFFHRHAKTEVRRLIVLMDKQRCLPEFLTRVQEQTNCVNTSQRRDSFQLILKKNFR